MSKSSITRRLSFVFVFVFSAALIGADLVVSAQDEQTRGGMMTTNSNMSNTTPRRTTRRRSNRRRAGMNANMSGDMSGDMSGGNANMSGDMSGQNANMSGSANMSGDMSGSMNMGTGRRRHRRGRRGGAGAAAVATTTTGGAGMMQENTSGGVQTDLSGNYTGTVNYPEGGLSGNATFNITANQFTITPESGSPASGTITAVTTRGYIGATLMFGDRTPPQLGHTAPPLPAISVRVRRVGSSISMMSVPGERRQFSFTPGGGRRMRRGRHMNMSACDNMTMSGGANTTMSGDSSGSMSGDMSNTNTNTSGRRHRRSRRRSRGMGNMNTGGSMEIKPPTAQPSPTP